MSESFLEQVTATPEGRRLFEQERLILDVTEQMCTVLEEEGISRATLAERLGKSKAYVSQLLDGRANMTLRTVADVFHAMGRSLQVSAVAPTPRPAAAPQFEEAKASRSPRRTLRVSVFTVQKPCGVETKLPAAALNLSA